MLLQSRNNIIETIWQKREKSVTEILDISPFWHDLALFCWKRLSSVFPRTRLASAVVSEGLLLEKFDSSMFILQSLPHLLRRPNSCEQAQRIWSSSSTPTPSWGTDLSSGGRSSIAPASPCGRRLTAWGHSPTKSGIWSRTQSTGSVSYSPGPGRAARGLLDLLWSAGQSVQVSLTEALNHFLEFSTASIKMKEYD